MINFLKDSSFGKLNLVFFSFNFFFSNPKTNKIQTDMYNLKSKCQIVVIILLVMKKVHKPKQAQNFFYLQHTSHIS